MDVWKEDLQEAQERMIAWWNHETTDRPVIQYTYIKPDVIHPLNEDHWYLAKHPDDFKKALADFETRGHQVFWGGEKIPRFHPNYGPGIMACVFGVEPIVARDTVWFNRPTPLEELPILLEQTKLNMNNPWYARLIKVTEYATERSIVCNRQFVPAFTDIGGILDIMASFIDPWTLIVALKRKPALVDAARTIILEKVLKLYDALASIIGKANVGYDAWLNVWCKQTWYPIQCDFSAMLSPTMFRRFVLPDLIAQAEHMDYAAYHLDGPNEIPFLDDLLKVPSIQAIQWVPGSNQPDCCDDKWIPMLKKIQAAGKNLILGTTNLNAIKIFKTLDPKGMLVSTNYSGKMMAEFYLPKFMGGMDGIDEE